MISRQPASSWALNAAKNRSTFCSACPIVVLRIVGAAAGSRRLSMTLGTGAVGLDREFSPCDQAMLHGVQGGGGPGGHADLGVQVLDMPVGGFRGNTQSGGDLFGGQPAGE